MLSSTQILSSMQYPLSLLSGPINTSTDSPYTFKDVKRIRNIVEFDRTFTAPVHGYDDTEYYWEVNSSRRFLSGIVTPTLLLNSLDDPILPASCYPTDKDIKNPFLYCALPPRGGHVGFGTSFSTRGEYWSESLVMGFFEEVLGRNN